MENPCVKKEDLFLQAKEFFNQRNFSKATDMFKEVINLDETCHEACNYIARCFQERNNNKESSEYSYKEALILEKIGKLEEAVSAFNR
jgi:Tfp pilus assembly protein PilF